MLVALFRFQNDRVAIFHYPETMFSVKISGVFVVIIKNNFFSKNECVLGFLRFLLLRL